MFVNFCSKLAFMKFNRLTHKITKNDTLSRTAARESLPKCFQLFQTAPEQPSWCKLFNVAAQVWATEAGYRPEFADCLPLKCEFFIFFQKTSIFVVFWVRIIRLLCDLWHRTPDVFCILDWYNSFSRQLVDESANKSDFIDDRHRFFHLAYNMQPHRPNRQPLRLQWVYA